MKSSSVELFPLPGERTLQRRTQNIKFAAGVQHQILDVFAEELKDFDDFDCIISFDDCSIKSRVDFDSGTQSNIGHVTLPNLKGLAIKGTIWVFAGVRRKWKVTGAYHFVPSEGCPDEVYAVLVELLQKALDLKLNVLGFVCDMANRGLLKKFGFSFKKNDIKYRVEHPRDKTKQLFCIPDMVHLYKSFKEALCNSKTYKLSHDIVGTYNLPSNTVKFNHIRLISKYQEEMDLKFLPKLDTKKLEANHFRKMNVPNANCVMNDKVGATLDLLAYCGDAEEECRTTAYRMVHPQDKPVVQTRDVKEPLARFEPAQRRRLH